MAKPAFLAKKRTFYSEEFVHFNVMFRLKEKAVNLQNETKLCFSLDWKKSKYQLSHSIYAPCIIASFHQIQVFNTSTLHTLTTQDVTFKAAQ